MSDYDPVLHALELLQEQSLQRTRQMLYEAGRPDLVEALDRNIKDVRNGVAIARSTWHSLSPAQRRALQYAGKRTRLKYRHSYCGLGEAEAPITKPTMRNLCRRELMAWDGGAFDPESAAVLTERGRFVLKIAGQNKPKVL